MWAAPSRLRTVKHARMIRDNAQASIIKWNVYARRCLVYVYSHFALVKFVSFTPNSLKRIEIGIVRQLWHNLYWNSKRGTVDDIYSTTGILAYNKPNHQHQNAEMSPICTTAVKDAWRVCKWAKSPMLIIESQYFS